MRLYVASSWKNERYDFVVASLLAAGHEVYDFRNPEEGNHGFAWSEIDPEWEQWTNADYIAKLEHARAAEGFDFDMVALGQCEGLVLVLPSGRSSHLEAGWARGAGKKLFILLANDAPPTPELMYLMADGICDSEGELLDLIEEASE